MIYVVMGQVAAVQQLVVVQDLRRIPRGGNVVVLIEHQHASGDLLDEPTSGLDPRSQGWLVEFILSQRRAGKTIVTATHDLVIAEQIATRLVVFDEQHRIAASGEPEKILHDHELLHRCNLSHFHVAPARLAGE